MHSLLLSFLGILWLLLPVELLACHSYSLGKLVSTIMNRLKLAILSNGHCKRRASFIDNRAYHPAIKPIVWTSRYSLLLWCDMLVRCTLQSILESSKSLLDSLLLSHHGLSSPTILVINHPSIKLSRGHLISPLKISVLRQLLHREGRELLRWVIVFLE